jgi:hypothetical protein
MHIERLERMERCLREYVANQDIYRFEFNMGIWSGHFKISDLFDGGKKEECCYTAGCAIGLALHQKIFEKEGLRNLSVGPVLVDDEGIHHHGFEAIEVLFDLNIGQARYLFTVNFRSSSSCKDCYGTEAALACADRIRALIDSVEPVEVVKVLELA